MLTAGHFLSEFVGFSDASGKKQIPWAHLDIAGPAKNDIAPYGYVGKGATGVMLRTLVQVARNLN
jgi:leucyl aminopeptidase